MFQTKTAGKLLLTLFIVVSFLSRGLAQSSVLVTASVMPPYSTLLSEYYSGDGSRISIQLLNTDPGSPILYGYLRVTIEGQGVKLQSNDYGNYPSLELMHGSPVMLNGTDLAPYFNPQNLTGNTGRQQNRLPEGFYQFCFEVLEKNTNRVIGSKQCGQAYLQLNDPPFLLLPEKGKAIAVSNPFNILFQWNPRHLNIASSEYQFDLVEIWDDGIVPEAAFYTAKPIYSTTVYSSTLFYGPGEPQLLMGKKYAWRVKAKVTTANNEQEPFKNDGYSEIFWFKLQGECMPLQKATVVADPRTNKTTLSWTPDVMNIGATTIDYRKKGSSKWATVTIETHQATITGLAWDTDYEYKLGNRCVITDDFTYGSLQSFKTLTQDTANCVPSTQAPLSNREPIAMLRRGDTIYASGFQMRLTQVSGANGVFSGQGYLGLIIPTTTTEVSVKAAFTNISINTDNQVFSGKIISLYDKTERGVGKLDPVIEGGIGVGEVKTGNTTIDATVNVPIDPTVNAVVAVTGTIPDTSYSVTITSVDGKPVTITTKKLPVVVQDSKGGIYSIDKTGKVTPIGKASAGLLAGKTTDVLDKLNSAKGKVTFEAHTEQVYAFDPYQADYDKSILFSLKYESLNNGQYRVANKLLITNSTDKIIAKINNLHKDLNEDSIHFITGRGVELLATKKASKTYEITLLSGPANDAQELYAIYRDNEGAKKNTSADFTSKDFTYSLGKLKIATYEPKEFTVKVVPVGNATIDADKIATSLNSTYNKIGIRWNVISMPSIGYEDWDSGDEALDIREAGKNNKYSAEMQKLNTYYTTKKGVEEKIPYLFVFDKAPVNGKGDVEGDMLRNRQFGYLFPSDKDKLASHELAHGMFHLEHTFEDKYNLSKSDLSDNLMNYEDGITLAKLQWDAVHAPGMVFGIFESEGDAASLQNPYVKCIEDASFATTLGKNFYDPDGNPVTLAADMQPYSFFSEKEPEYYGRLAAYKKGGNTYIYWLATSSQGPVFAGRWYKVGSAVPTTEQQASQLTRLVNATSASYVKFNSQCEELTSKKYVTSCTGCLSMPHERKSTSPKGTSGSVSTGNVVVNYSQDANGNSLIETAEADKIASVIGDANTKLGTKTRTYIINKQNKNFTELLAQANADPSKEKIIVIINGTKSQYTINIQHKLDAPEWLRNAFAGVSTNSNGCVEGYINDALASLHATDTYKQSSLAEQVTAETLVSIYRGVFGNLYCVTDEQSVANGSATKKFVAGAIHELVATVDVAEMVKGLASVAKGIASSVVEAEVSYIKDQIFICNSLVSGSSVPVEELIQKMLPPKARLAVKAAQTVTKVASHFTQFYFTACEGEAQFGSNMCPYRYGQVTIMVVPIVLTAGEWAFVKAGQMVGRLRTFNNLSKTEEVVSLIGTAEKNGAEIINEVDKIVVKDGDDLSTVTKSGDEVFISKEIQKGSSTNKLVSKASSENIAWKNIDESNIIWANPNSNVLSTAKSFANEVGTSLYDVALNNGFYAKVDLVDGRILLGQTNGTFNAFAVINDNVLGAFKSSVLNVSDELFNVKLLEFIESNSNKLKVISGAVTKQLTIAGKLTNLNANKVNTMLGRFRPDISNLFEELGSFKNVGLGERNGGINILNKPDYYYDAATWWESYNKPWLDKAISRGDDVYLVTIPQKADDIIKNGKLVGAYSEELNHLVLRNYKPVNISMEQWNNIKEWIIN